MNSKNHRLLILAGTAVALLAGALLWTLNAPASMAQNGTPPATPQPEQEQILSGILPGLPPGTMLVEGDIVIDIADYYLRYPSLAADQPNARQGVYVTNFWYNGGVPVEFDANVTANNRKLALDAMAWWENVAGVDFVECPNGCSDIVNDWVHIQNSPDGNNSRIGMIGGMQILNIRSWNVGTIAHELGHTLGMEHEQVRSNRDQFVRINTDNICLATDEGCGKCYDENYNRVNCDRNFSIRPDDPTYYVPYDFDSIMHYGRMAFSRNGKDTITVLPPNDTRWQNAIGQRDHLSQGDIRTAGCMYPRPEWRWVNVSAVGETGAGDCRRPYTNLGVGLSNTPQNGVLWIEPGTYSGVTMLSKPLTLKAPNGSVFLKP